MPREDAYWAARRRDLLAQMSADEQELFERLERLYATEVAKLERDIAMYYASYGEGSVIEYRRLLASASESDRVLLIEKMDEFAKKYPEHAHLMPVRESIYTLNELEAVQLSMRLQQLEIGAVEVAEVQAHLEELSRRAANLAAGELGFGTSFYTANAQVIAATVGAAWAQGRSFSERIWENREKLAAYLNDDFAKLVARGVSYDKCVADMARRFEGVSKRDIRRLVFTEGTFVLNESQAQVHEHDFEHYSIACADSRACEACKELQREQGEHPVRFSDRSPGVNFPPLHPWCRCSYTVEVDDWDAWIDAYVAARGGDGAAPREVMA